MWYCQKELSVMPVLLRRGLVHFWAQRGLPSGVREERKVHLRSTGRRQADCIAPVIGTVVHSSLHLRLCPVTRSGDLVPSSSHALGVRRQVFSGWADGSAAVLGYFEEAAEETQSRTYNPRRHTLPTCSCRAMCKSDSGTGMQQRAAVASSCRTSAMTAGAACRHGQSARTVWMSVPCTL